MEALYRLSVNGIRLRRPAHVPDACRDLSLCGSRQGGEPAWREGNLMKRPTIADIAARAGVTKAAVSFALNGQPGVSAATRQRILGIEPFFMQLLSGIQADLSQHHVTLQFSTAEDSGDEIALYRQWWAQRRVDGVFLVDLQRDDPRIGVLEELRMPAVVIGSPLGSGSLPAVWQDEREVVESII